MIPALSTRSLSWRERALLVVLSGLLVPIAQPPFNWWWCALPATFLLCRAVVDTSARQAFWYGLLHGLLGYGFSLFWMTYIFKLAAVPLYGILALFVAIFCLLLNLVARRWPRPWVVVGLGAALWTALEYVRCELWFLRFPWVTPGTAWGPTLLSPYVGVYGVSFLLVGAVLAMAFRRTMYAGLLVAVWLAALAVWRPGPVTLPPGVGLDVALVQSEDCFLNAYLRLTRDHVDPGVDLIVWPEYAIPYDIRQSPDELAKLRQLCADLGAVLIVGTKTEIPAGGWYNTALVLDANGVLGEYYKHRPVHFFDDGTPGTGAHPVRTPLGVIGTPICFDNDYTDIVRRQVVQGAVLLAAPVFDAEDWSWVQHEEHAWLFRLRAAENGRWVAAAATSGVTQIVDPRGNVIGRLPTMRQAVLRGRIGWSARRTVFSRGGWLLPWLAVAVAVGTGAALIPRVRARDPGKPE